MFKKKLSVFLNKNNFYIISVSGGIDSMTLLHFLCKKKYKLVVVHFNHLLRKESFKDKLIIKKYCDENNIPFYYFELKFSSKNIQNESRLLRKKKLKEIASLYKTNYILTAHHLDDLSETILFKLARGSSLLGYAGMKNISKDDEFYFLKPFLYFSKQKIIHYALKNKVSFLEDKTNNSNKYTRNKIRNQIIPFFKSINDNFLKNIKHFHLQMSDAYDYIREKTNIFLIKNKKNNGFCLKYFLKLQDIIQQDIILFLFEENKINKNFFLIKNIIKGLKNFYKPNIKWELNEKWEFIKTYEYFELKKKQIKNIFLQKNNKKNLLYSCTNKKLLLFCDKIIKINFDLKNVLKPFILRKRNPGDILQFSYGKKKLSKFLIEKKVISFEREKLFCIVDSNNVILWIPELYINSTLGKENFIYLGLKFL
ncbi:tRNA lysidine(34) synthetase TilS [Texas Phoenix palm phytoplasma]|uniref:tRNA lysidine(34) synthetase TilS n=1 Tax=Texas Phoenix palm phytoplasma TaxID=176709 RepID=UPI00280B0167|nr:tRNA lysidine(34) synthetase TilS [Texas Phoenix palm phytoplasma]